MRCFKVIGRGEVVEEKPNSHHRLGDAGQQPARPPRLLARGHQQRLGGGVSGHGRSRDRHRWLTPNAARPFRRPSDVLVTVDHVDATDNPRYLRRLATQVREFDKH